MNSENCIVNCNYLITSFDCYDMNIVAINSMIEGYKPENNIASMVLNIQEGEEIMNDLFTINS